MFRFILTLIFLIAASAQAGEPTLRQKLFSRGEVALSVAGSGLSPAGSPTAGAKPNPEDLNPGKALMLSAIIPGAGQYSLGYNIKAAVFFAVEVAAWYSVIYYYDKGQDKDKEFKAFADLHFDEMNYRNMEFERARSPQWGDSQAYSGTLDEWTEEDWETKSTYLPKEGFTHEIPTKQQRSVSKSQDQQYYEMIGKYIRQFGFGWDDNFGDEAGTPWFDGESPRSLFYMDMRYDSNQLLDRSSLAIQIAMLNHVASALDASFTARLLKRRAQAQVGFRQVEHNGHAAVVGGLNVRW